jgi:MoaA/NifB/PqqE/SkfB family radical SAM enzyme
MSEFKCAWLENMISVEPDGWTRPCCGETSELARISNIKNGLVTAFNHPKLLKLKQDLVNGFNADTRYACQRCEFLESKGSPSLRTGTPFLSDKRELKTIQFKMSNKCQLACAHCGPELSSTWSKLLKISPHVLNSFEVTDEFLAELVELLPNIKCLKFTGGEPFLDPAHWKILEHLSNYDRSHCTLKYITNGLVRPRYELWKGWKSVDCSVSVDGHNKTYEWFRRNASWNELVDCVDNLKEHSDVSIVYAITPWTAESYQQSKEFWKFPLFSFPIVKPQSAGLENFPRHIAEKYFPHEFLNLTSYNNTSLDFYKSWAVWWDSQWNTPGKCFDLFPWLQE